MKSCGWRTPRGSRRAAIRQGAGFVPGPLRLCVPALQEEIADLQDVAHGVVGGEVLVGAHEGAGGVEGGGIRIGYRCPNCGAEWDTKLRRVGKARNPFDVTA